MRDFTDELRDVARRVTEASGYLGIEEARNRLVELEGIGHHPHALAPAAG